MSVRILSVISAVAFLTAFASKADAGAKSESLISATQGRGELKAVIFESKPFAQKDGKSYTGLAVDVLEHVKDEAGLTSVTFLQPKNINEGFEAISSGEADIACGVSFSWDRAKSVNYSLPFAIGGTRLLAGAGVDGTPESLQGRTIGVVKDSASAKVLADVVPKAELITFQTPVEALAAFQDDKVQILGGPSLWLAANKGGSGKLLVPVRPYARSGIGCVVKQDNGKLLASANIAIGQMMQAYVDGDTGSREMVNRWVGPGSSIDLPESTISALYRLMLSTTAEISTNVQDPADLAAVEESEPETKDLKTNDQQDADNPSN